MTTDTIPRDRLAGNRFAISGDCRRRRLALHAPGQRLRPPTPGTQALPYRAPDFHPFRVTLGMRVVCCSTGATWQVAGIFRPLDRGASYPLNASSVTLVCYGPLPFGHEDQRSNVRFGDLFARFVPEDDMIAGMEASARLARTEERLLAAQRVALDNLAHRYVP